MKLFKRILHATDFSRASRPALVKAMALAHQNGAPLSIVHGLLPSTVPIGGDMAYLSPATYETIDRSARQHARKQLEILAGWARKAGVRATVLLLDGIPHEQILRAPRRTRADLIVSGTHGRTGFSKIFLGIVAERVVRFATCPVLTIRGR